MSCLHLDYFLFHVTKRASNPADPLPFRSQADPPEIFAEVVIMPFWGAVDHFGETPGRHPKVDPHSDKDLSNPLEWKSCCW